MNILLLQPPIEDFYSTPIRFYPLGLLYVANVLERLGHHVNILDCLTAKKRQLVIPGDFSYLKKPFAKSPYLFKGYYRFGLSDDTILKHIARHKPDAIGISAQFTAYFQTVAHLAKLIKSEFNTPIFIGGNHATAFAREIRERVPAIDDILVGPAEVSIPNHPRLNPNNSINFVEWKYLQPSHKLLETSAYKIGKRNYISLIASRGCPYTCEFCSVHAMFGRHIEYRSIESVLQEMRWNYEQNDTRIFNFEDDNLSFNSTWFTQFLKNVIDDDILQNIELTAMNGMCYPTLGAALLNLMYKAGFRQLNLSYVTHDSVLRRKLNRPERSDSFETVVKAAQSLEFFVTVYLIFGLPEQTYEEIKSSVDYLLSLGVLVGPSVFYIPPGSALYHDMSLPSNVLDNWNLYRSSAFAVETPSLSRAQLIELFAYTREQNLLRKQKENHHVCQY